MKKLLSTLLGIVACTTGILHSASSTQIDGTTITVRTSKDVRCRGCKETTCYTHRCPNPAPTPDGYSTCASQRMAKKVAARWTPQVITSSYQHALESYEPQAVFSTPALRRSPLDY